VPYKLTYMLARQKKLGLWAYASPTPPWDFRRGNRTAKAHGASQIPPWDFRPIKPTKAPGSKPPTTATGPIAGNRSSKIYHLPNCPDYSKVSERNRVLFKTEAEAQAAGYRKARDCPQ